MCNGLINSKNKFLPFPFKKLAELSFIQYSLLTFLPVGNSCLVQCTNGRTCRKFGKHFCLCPKGKKGRDCKENGKLNEERRIFF